MGKRYFRKKLLNLVCVLLLLTGYQTLIHIREQNEQIEQLEYELEAAKEGTSETLTEEKTNSLNESEMYVYEDGIYSGAAQGFGGEIEAEVVIQEGKIASIEIVKAEGEDAAYLDTAKSVIDSMIEEQSANVDTVSGATFSSGGIRDAVADALEEAVKE